MAAPACTEQEFVELWKSNPSVEEMVKALGVSERQIHARRRRIESRRNIKLVSLNPGSPDMKVTVPHDKIRTTVDMQDGVILVGSDAHYWPGIVSTAHRAAVHLTKALKPMAFCLNGDAFDGAAPGRHGRIMWERKPSVKEELEAVQDRLEEIERVAGIAKLFYNWGNHDQRFDTKLSAQVPEFEGVPGFTLKDHLPRWQFGMSLMINGNTMIKHRYHNGIHATYNNVLKSGTSMVTGHLHALQVRPYTDYNGTRYAVDTGTLAHPSGPQFTYAEDGPANHRSGLAVLTFKGGRLMPPELVEVVDEEGGMVFFRGQLIKV